MLFIGCFKRNNEKRKKINSCPEQIGIVIRTFLSAVKSALRFKKKMIYQSVSSNFSFFPCTNLLISLSVSSFLVLTAI